MGGIIGSRCALSDAAAAPAKAALVMLVTHRGDCGGHVCRARRHGCGRRQERGWLPLGVVVWATSALARAHPPWRRSLQLRWRLCGRRPSGQLKRGADSRDSTAAGVVTEPAGMCLPRRRTHAPTAARLQKSRADGRDGSAAGGVTACRHVPPAPLRPGALVPAQHSQGTGVLCIVP